MMSRFNELFYFYAIRTLSWRDNLALRFYSISLRCDVSTPPPLCRSPWAAIWFIYLFISPLLCLPSHPLTLTWAHGFCIRTATSTQYFSFTPVSFKFLPPSGLAVFLLLYLRRLGQSRLLKISLKPRLRYYHISDPLSSVLTLGQT